MIKTSNQLRVAREHIERFRAAIAEAEAHGPAANIHPRVHQAYIDGMKAKIETLRDEVKEYNHLTARDASCVRLKSFADLPKNLIRARIYRGMTQSKLAEKLGVKPQQVQRWEAEDNGTVSFSMLVAMAKVLEVEVSAALVDNRVQVIAGHPLGQSVEPHPCAYPIIDYREGSIGGFLTFGRRRRGAARIVCYNDPVLIRAEEDLDDEVTVQEVTA